MEWFSQQSIDMSLWALDQNEILHSQPTQIAGSRHFWASGAEPQLPSRTSRRSAQRLYLLQTSNLTIPNSRELFHRHKAVFAPRGIVQRYQGRSFEKKEGRSPSVAKMPSILLTIDRRSPLKSSRSRWARRASSSPSLGIGTIEHTRGSPLSQAIKVRSNISTSMMSVFARRARRSTGRLEGCMT